MGNMLARQTRRQISIATYDAIGGIVESDPKRDPGTFGPGYSGGPEWFMNEAERLMNEL